MGLNIYGPEGLVATDTAESDPGAQVTFTAERQLYLYQVFNYDPAYSWSTR